jgi:hypothetical protein
MNKYRAMVTRLLLLVGLAFTAKGTNAQSGNCAFKPPFFTMHFGKGNVQDVNSSSLAFYDRVHSACPTDGHYSFTPTTEDCFRGDWHTIMEDHTPGDVAGNMLLVNSAYDPGVFLTTTVKGFKSETAYQFGVWLMNVCKPSRKCPFPLLPNLTIRLQTPAGKTVAQFVTGELQRPAIPHWTQHRGQFTVPPSVTELTVIFLNNAPGGCGNDLALDDITFQECVKPDPVKPLEAKNSPPSKEKKQLPVPKKEPAKATPPPSTIAKTRKFETISRIEKAPPKNNAPFTPKLVEVIPVPPLLKQRTNPLIKEIKTVAGEIKLDLYDNGEIDGDTVSIYHNNSLIAFKKRLSQQPISFHIQVDKVQPYHELIMVANNLGSIPPNTSLMIVTTKDKRYQVSISSTEQQNAKVVIKLEEE